MLEVRRCRSLRAQLLVSFLAVTALGACTDGSPPVNRIAQRSTGSPSFVTFAYKEVSIGPQGKVAGSLGVRDASESGLPAQLTLSSGANVAGDVLADQVHIEKNVVVRGQVQGNTLDISSHANLSQPAVTPLALPLADITPPIPSVQPGAESVTVAAQATQTLAAGAYGQVVLLDGRKPHPTVLRLEGGLYQLKEQAGSGQLMCSSSPKGLTLLSPSVIGERS